MKSKNTRDMSSVLPALILKTKSFIFSIESNVIYFKSINFANNTENVIFSVFSFLTKKYHHIHREKIFSLSCFNVLFAEDHVWFSIDKREIPSILITQEISYFSACYGKVTFLEYFQNINKFLVSCVFRS